MNKKDEHNFLLSKKGWIKNGIIFAITVVVLLLLFLYAVNTGSLKTTPQQLWKGLFIEYDSDVAIVYDIRFPRIMIAMIGGTLIALSGVLLQAVMKNPLADPGIIGISSGASLTSVLVVAFFPSLFQLAPLFAFAGGMFAFCLVYGLSYKGGLSPVRIILVGIAVNSMFTGIMSAFNSATGSSYSGVASIVNANISMKTWSDFKAIVGYAIAIIIAALFVARTCDLLALEDKTVQALGICVVKKRLLISVIAVLAASVATAVMGTISFLGLIVPHISRLLIGNNHKVLIPYSMILGAVFMLGADTIGRIVAYPYEISASIIMSVIGGPFFVFLLRRSDRVYGTY